MLPELGTKWLHARFGFANHLTPSNCVFRILLEVSAKRKVYKTRHIYFRVLGSWSLVQHCKGVKMKRVFSWSLLNITLQDKKYSSKTLSLIHGCIQSITVHRRRKLSAYT